MLAYDDFLMQSEIMTEQEILKQAFDHIAANHSGGEATFTADDGLLENGIIDSLGLLDLVAFLEQAFSITVDDDDVTLDNFESVRSIARFVASKRRP